MRQARLVAFAVLVIVTCAPPRGGAAPKVVDLSVTKTDGLLAVYTGQVVTYTIVASNAGPDTATHAQVIDAFPAQLTGVSWTCVASAGSSCPAPSGSGDINQVLVLLAGGTATFSATGTVNGTSGLVTNTVSISTTGATDPDPSNDSATDSDSILPLVSVNDVAVPEGPPAGVATFAVTLSYASDQTITVDYTTVDGSAVAPGDYAAGSGTLTFAPGEVSAPIAVAIVGDTVRESDETFTVSLGSAAPVADGVGIATILNDDFESDLQLTNTDGASIALAGQSVSYTLIVSNAGPDATVDARVTDSFPTDLASVTWTCTAGGGAACVGSGSGDIDQLVSLAVGSSATFVATGTLAALASGTLSNGASVALTELAHSDPQPANNSASDDDAIDPLTVSISDAAVVEGNTGTATASFTVGLSHAAAMDVTVDYASADDTATAPDDYTAGSGTLTFAGGVLSQPLSIEVVGDTSIEGNETFFVDLSNATASIGDGRGAGLIVNDDPPRELAHGASEVQTLAAGPGPTANVDRYALLQAPYSSYEVVVDGVSGDAQPLEVVRTSADELTLQLSQAAGLGSSRSLRFRNALATPVADELVRVRSGGCGPDCGDDDAYRIRFYETTCAIPRFNNSGSQFTIVVLQNPADYGIGGTLYFWSGSGALLASSDFALGARQTWLVNTVGIAALAGKAGAITIAHDGRYGDLAGKAVALEPATGFSFDAPLIWRAVR